MSSGKRLRRAEQRARAEALRRYAEINIASPMLHEAPADERLKWYGLTRGQIVSLADIQRVFVAMAKEFPSEVAAEVLPPACVPVATYSKALMPFFGEAGAPEIGRIFDPFGTYGDHQEPTCYVLHGLASVPDHHMIGRITSDGFAWVFLKLKGDWRVYLYSLRAACKREFLKDQRKAARAQGTLSMGQSGYRDRHTYMYSDPA